jgi:hypothetical protein
MTSRKRPRKPKRTDLKIGHYERERDPRPMGDSDAWGNPQEKHKRKTAS